MDLLSGCTCSQFCILQANLLLTSNGNQKQEKLLLRLLVFNLRQVIKDTILDHVSK